MITIIIVEDDDSEREYLKELTLNFFQKNGEECRILLFSDGADCLANYPERPDLILMDIDMPGINGLDAARKIRAFDQDVLIVFVTNLVQCAVEGYAVEAIDFIVKPVTESGFELSAFRVLRRIRKRRGANIEIRSRKSTISVNTAHILYAETMGRAILLHMDDGTDLTASEPIRGLEQRLSPFGFFRCHTSFIVNLSAVDTIGKTDALVRGVLVPVSKYRRNDFLKAVACFMGGAY